MLCLLLIVVAGAAPTDSTAEPTSAVALSIRMAESIGATVHKLALNADVSITNAERTNATRALERTGLFELVDPALAEATVHIKRIDPTVVLATVTDRDQVRLWVGQIRWPAPAPDAAPTAASAHKNEGRFQRLQQFRRERLTIWPIFKAYAPSPFAGVGWGMRWPWGPHRRHWGNAAVRMDHVGAIPVETTPTGWVVLRGRTEVIDDESLARLLDKPTLAQKIEDERFWPKLWWVVGFGAASVAGVTAGSMLYQKDDRDIQTVGISLIALGAVSGVLALLFPSVGPNHVLSAAETEKLVDQYNEHLREQLRLRPRDIREPPVEPVP